jgi:hypothetical protein
VQGLALQLQTWKFSATSVTVVAVLHIVVPLVMRFELGCGTERFSAVQAFHMGLCMTAFMDLLLQSIAKAHMTLLALDAALLSVEWQVFLVYPIASWLANISI